LNPLVYILHQILTSNNFQLNPLVYITPKLGQIHSRRLAGVHRRQAIQPKTQNLGCSYVSPSGQGAAARWFFFRNPKRMQKWCVAWR